MKPWFAPLARQWVLAFALSGFGPMAGLMVGLTASLMVGLMPAAAVAAPASDVIRVRDPQLRLSLDDRAWLLSANVELALPDRLAEAVERGVPLYFVVEFELNRPRWWWWDEDVVRTSQTWRLSYHALTRQYRVSLNGLAQQFGTLGEAVRALSMVRGWPVAQADQIRPDTTYQAQVRMRLDASQLPKPFQVTAITNRDWNLQSEWTRFTFSPETATSAR